MDDELGLLVTAATEAADRNEIGRGLVYACSALAVSLGRFATAITPQENT